MKSVFDLTTQHTDVGSKIFVAIERIAEVSRFALWDICKNKELTHIQANILIYTRFHEKNEQITITSLARHFMVTKATVSDSVKTLQSKKMLKKAVNQKDKRITFLALTGNGKKLADEVALFAIPIHEQFDSFSEEKKATILETLLFYLNRLQIKGMMPVQRMCPSCTYLCSRKSGYYCKFLKSNIAKSALRIDCPEHLPL